MPFGARRPPLDTAGNLNYRLWVGFSPVEKNVYLIGVTEGLREGLPADQKATLSVYFPAVAYTLNEVSRGLDKLCEAPENSNVRIGDSLQIVAMKANGADPSEVETKIAAFRRSARGLQEKAK